MTTLYVSSIVNFTQCLTQTLLVDHHDSITGHTTAVTNVTNMLHLN